MGMIFGAGQNKFARIEITWVEIEGTRFRKAMCLSQFLFERVGKQLDFRQAVGSDKAPEGQELFA
ncbi:hypothetical protein HRbin36_01698 [bacterium HR36]|nr:hypothetical protein HRbin36_01698 [bacterium HR36]